jgi:uncharacterized tellurite resistance protein B-like protein
MKNNLDINTIVSTAALLVHIGKTDEEYTIKERNIVRNFIKTLTKKEDVENLLQDAENLEKNSNQLLDFTKKIKEQSIEFKTIIIEQLWQIVISDENIDQYETNLIRRVCGLIYFPDKLSGEIKLRLLNKNS